MPNRKQRTYFNLGKWATEQKLARKIALERTQQQLLQERLKSRALAEKAESNTLLVRAEEGERRYRFNLGEWSKQRKRKRGIEKIESKESLNKIDAAQKLIKQAKRRLVRLNDENDNISQKIARTNIRKRPQVDLAESGKRGKWVNKSSEVCEANSECLTVSRREQYERRCQTISAAISIHQSTSDAGLITSRDKLSKPHTPKAALDGLWFTLINSTTPQQMKTYLTTSPKVNEKFIPSMLNEALSKFENSESNLTRSVRAMYESGVLSKPKYYALRKSELQTLSQVEHPGRALQFYSHCRIPRLLPYFKVVDYVSKLDIGNLEPLISSEGKQVGMKRNVEELLVKIASLYLTIRNYQPDILNWFDKQEGCFQIAIGADGAPFGKHGQATAWLVSFLNVRHRVASPDDNFLLLGANIKEDDPVMIDYATSLSKELEVIQKNQYSVGNLKVTFKVSLLPFDQKGLASISGELSNAAQYFSSFADVSKQNKDHIGGDIGPGKIWKEWKYEKRITDAEAVQKFKSLPKNKSGKAKTVRPKVTQFIASRKSREEFVPPLGRFIQFAKVEPLHLKNNAWQYFFQLLLIDAVAGTPQKDIENGVKIENLPSESYLCKFLSALKYKVRAGKLYNKIVKYFSENKVNSNAQISAVYRFTGEESRKLAWHFMSLVHSVMGTHDTMKRRFRLALYAYIGLLLRDITSRFHLNEGDLLVLKQKCKFYFNLYSLFLDVNNTVWHIGYVVPKHAESMYEQFKMGLGLNTMEGREAKHLRLLEYSENSTAHNRWALIFRHEYVMLYWLRRKNPKADKYRRANLEQYELKEREKYIPSVYYDNPGYCVCGSVKDETMSACKICNDPVMAEIKQAAVTGKISSKLKKIAN